MSDQLALFGMGNDARPLPEIIASGGDGWAAFDLQMQDHEGKRYYAVRDWLIGVTLTDDPGDYWKKLKKRAAKAELTWGDTISPYLYTDAQNKRIKVDFATDKGLYAITQRMDTNTGIRNKVLAYLVDAGVALDEMRRDPGIAIDAGVAAYKRQGKSDEWIEARNSGKIKRNEMTEAAYKTHETHAPAYGTLTDTEYRVLFGAPKSDLVKALSMSSADSARFRDHLGKFAITALETAESGAAMRMEQLGRALTHAEQADIVEQAVRIVAPSAMAMAAFTNTDLLTGRSALKAGVR